MVLNLKVVIFFTYQNTKTFWQKVTLQIGLKKFSILKKLKTLFHGHMASVILTERNSCNILRKIVSKID